MADRAKQAPAGGSGEPTGDPQGRAREEEAPARPATATPPGEPLTTDLFDLERLRVSQNFADTLGVRKVLTTVPVMKPNRQWFVRVHPAADHRLTVALIELKEERLTFLVTPEIAAQLPEEVTLRMLFTAVTRQGTVFLWPVRLPTTDGRTDHWNRSAMEAAERAQRAWVRVVANMSLGAYEVYEATAELPEPIWPDVSFRELVEIAFRERLITTHDHPVLRRLRGEV